MSPEPLEVLKRYYGYDAFRTAQAQIIDSVMEGRDTFVLMPTGAGKSLCFQIPGIVRSGTAIVVSPLISLMKDQVDALRQNGVRAAYLNSSMNAESAREVMGDFDNGKLDLLYVAPERLMMHDFQHRLSRQQVALFAIDEAHCVSQWGHDFRREYVQLGELRPKFPNVPFIALTATADPLTREDILLRLNLQNPNVFVSGFDRPNIRYTVVEKARPLLQTEEFIRARPDDCGIVYCLSRKKVEAVAEHLTKNGIKALAYHAGMSSSERGRTQERFQQDEIQVVVATVAFGMGIDKPNVRFVIHFDIPKNVEGFYQETGRAGRDGLPAEALLLFSAGDIVTVKKLISMGENREQKEIELKKLNSIIDFAEAQTCRRRLLLSYFGELRSEDCGNCDVCLDPPERFDGTADARTALMAVYELRQRFGVLHLIDFLRGSQNERILKFRHQELETYGSGKHRTSDDWQSIVRQLIHLGYLKQDTESYNALKLTPLTKPLLREGVTLLLAKPRVKVEKEKRRKGPSGGATEYDEELFHRLRALRRSIADEEKVPPYVVFDDKTLTHMAASKPTTLGAFRQISGVGDRKLERYGARFIAEIAG
jgi:ATP-dependent DNA helicase RecQ